jgi:hypothetical protein
MTDMYNRRSSDEQVVKRLNSLETNNDGEGGIIIISPRSSQRSIFTKLKLFQLPQSCTYLILSYYLCTLSSIGTLYIEPQACISNHGEMEK